MGGGGGGLLCKKFLFTILLPVFIVLLKKIKQSQMLQHVQESAAAQTSTAAALGKMIHGRQATPSTAHQNGTTSSSSTVAPRGSNGNAAHMQHSGKMSSHHMQRSSGQSQHSQVRAYVVQSIIIYIAKCHGTFTACVHILYTVVCYQIFIISGIQSHSVIVNLLDMLIIQGTTSGACPGPPP